MRPVDHTALLIPFVLTAKLDFVAAFQRIDARGEIDVVTDKDRLTTAEIEDEALVTRTIQIIGERRAHPSAALDHFA